MKIRIKFTKTGTMRFIGHLDLMRYFQKLMRRAKVDIRYTEGFSPHQIMSFATAMGLGMTSEGEYVDIDVFSTESSDEMLRRLNAASNDEIRMLRYCRLPDETKSAMAQITAADYVVSFPKNAQKDPAWHEEKIAQFCAQESIVLLKKTKKSEQETDIRPMILSFCRILDNSLQTDNSVIHDSRLSTGEDVKSSSDQPVFLQDITICPAFIQELAPAAEYSRVFLRLATGSEQNLKPELVMKAFFDFLGEEVPESALKIHRTEIYGKRDGVLIPLSAYGWDI